MTAAEFNMAKAAAKKGGKEDAKVLKAKAAAIKKKEESSEEVRGGLFVFRCMPKYGTGGLA